MPKHIISSLTGTTGPSSARFRLFNSAGIIAAIGLAALPAIFSLAPMFSVAEANAEPSTIGAAATIVPNLSLSAENVSMIMTPTGSGTVFKTASVDAIVSTNNETGYTLYFSDKDDNTSLKHTNLADKAIASTETSVTGESMLPNTWGYTLDAPAPEGENEFNNATNLGLTYNSIPTDYATINSSDTLTEGETSKLTFGVKINNGIPSGTYSDEILISAIINYSSTGYDQSQLWLGADGNQIETMQEMTPAVCASVPTPTVSAMGANIPTITLTDTRDSKTYTVKKLADGNCWMTDDLKIAGEILTPANSNVTTEVTLPPAKAISPENTPDTYTEAKIGINGINGAYLYNLFAAMAATSDVRDTTFGNAPQDVCPKGWHLPNNTGNASWDRLLNRVNGVYKSITPASLASGDNILGLHATGIFGGGSRYGNGNGYYWSRITDPGAGAHYLYFDSGVVNPKYGEDKHYGVAVRCVADNKEYMQDWNGCSGLTENNSVTLKDARDNKEYTVAKIGSQCWMTKNLEIGGDEEMMLDEDLTDSSSDYELPKSKTASSFSNNDAAYVYIDSNGSNGGYYSWRAVTAGTGTTSVASGNASASICPKGWKLPTQNQFDTLIAEGGAANMSKAPFNAVLSGFYDFGSLGDQDAKGYYWSSTAYDGARAVLMSADMDYARVGYSNKRVGCSVRCVLDS